VPSEFDVVVLGAGVAGTAAALAAAQTGADVCVIAGPPGASGLFAGAWRGPCPDALQKSFANAGYELHACKHALPHPNGSVSACDFAPSSHHATQLRPDALVCGIAGLAGFHATMLATIWSAKSTANLRAATISLEPTPAAGWAPASLAAWIERAPVAFARALRAAATQHDVRRIIVPAVLGTGYDDAVRRRIEDESGLHVGEALGVPPSLPGWRLHNALQRALADAGVTILHGRAGAALPVRGRINEVGVHDDVVRAGAFVLATGKFVSGGIEANGAFREVTLDCPVWVEHLGEAFDTPDPLNLTDPVRTEDQPLLRAGVHTDESRRPVNRMNDVVYSNVFVAGSIRAEWLSDSHGVGHAAEDGWRAGLAAVRP